MKLAEYLKQRGLSDAEFAKRIGATRAQVWNYKRKRQPRADRVAAIERVTRGLVRAKDFSVSE